MKLNEKILYYRKKAGLSQEALAEKIGVSRQAVSKWETGDAIPEISNLLFMAKTFGVTTDHFLSDDEPNTIECQTGNGRENDYDNGKGGFFDRVSKGLSIIGRIAKRFGWLSGVYVAFSGVPLLIVGIIMRCFAKASLDIIEFVTDTGANVVITDGFGKTYSSTAEALLSNPFGILSSVIIGVGALTVIFGVVLALYLKIKFSRK